MKKILFSLIVAVSVLTFPAAAAETEPESDLDYNPYLVLVNKTHELPSGWENVVHIDKVENSLGEELKIERRTSEAFERLRSDLLEQGVQIELDSVYRSVDEQQEIWDAWSADPELGEEYCKKYLAVPGYSEHHTGLAVDIFLIKDGEQIRENDDMIADTEDFAKIHELLPKYGFILRYLEGKEDVTGYAYEPWHLRYIDDPELATELTSQGLTLEEYLDAD